MGLVQKYSRQMRRAANLFPVWPPADPRQVGDVVRRNRKEFHKVAGLSDDFGINFNIETGGTGELAISSAGTGATYLQGGGSVSVSDLDLEAEAQVDVSMRQKNSFFLRTPRLTSAQIGNLHEVAMEVRQRVPSWRHGKWWLVTGVYVADDFVFLGSYEKKSSAKFQGAAKFLVEMVNVGVSANVQMVGSERMSYHYVGDEGPVALTVARITKKGKIVIK